MFVLKTLNLDDVETKQYISFIPQYKKNYEIKKYFNENHEVIFLDINEIYIKPDVIAIINKFEDIFNLVNDMLQQDSVLYKEYENFLFEYVQTDPEDRLGVFFEYGPILLTHIDDLFYKLDLSKDLIVKQNSAYKLNISLEETVFILLTSIRMRFFIPCLIGNLAVDEYQQKVIYNMISQEMIEKGILQKLFNIIMSMIMATNPETTSKKLWGFLSRGKGYTYDNHILELITSVYQKALPSIKPTENPIAYLISIAKNELNWLMQTAMSNLFLPSTIDTVSMIKPRNDILESEIFYRVIVQKILFDIAEEYKEYSSLYHYNVYTVLNNITQPLIIAIFNLPIKAFNISNVHLLNFFTHKFLKMVILNMRFINMETILLTAPMPNMETKTIVRLPENLNTKITNTLRPYFLNKKINHLSLNTIKKYYINTIFNLYKNKYFDTIQNKYVTINWLELIEELIYFTVTLTTGGYNMEIEKIKKSLYDY